MLREDEPLDSVWEELVFTESRLRGDEQAKEFTPVVVNLIVRVDDVRSGQLSTRREEVAAQAAVGAADDQLDDWIKAFDRALSDVVRGDKQSPRYRRYFMAAPWTFIRLGLESEVLRVRGWVDSLATEPEQTLKDFGARLAELITLGEAALEQRRKAVSARSDHRVRAITSLIEDVNAARGALYGNLATKAGQAHLPLDWPSRFFKRSMRTPKAEDVPVPSPAPASS
jgi:hypothetical protein